jgi:LAO/AO transport system kinase
MNDIQTLWKGILKKDRRSIAKAITLLESSKNNDLGQQEDLLKRLMDNNKKKPSLRIGVSGITGAGKSTFIENIGMSFIKDGKNVAVLAVDPSSPISGGSILGDKTRMEKLSNHECAFVRPSPNKANSGGLSISTRESILVLENAGFDVIFVETVGVGQSEYLAHSLVDLFLVLLLPSTGDELQGAKKGINELADLIIINKADRDLENQAGLTRISYAETLGEEKVLLHSNFKKENLKETYQYILSTLENSKISISKKRSTQNLQWTRQAVEKKCSQKIKTYFEENQIANQQPDKIYQIADEIFSKLFS